jgi:BirA family biotin operon repressor/biotin-[acetyl-CoA-carboxylase] ligase
VDDALTPDNVLPLLRGRFGKPYVYRPVCESTQELVRGLPEGAVAATEEQTAGRGRHGRTWVSPPGTGILMSLSLWPRTPPDRVAALSLVLADAACEALDPRAAVRWPNDVIVDGRKLAGVLAELQSGQVVAGFGINANGDHNQLPEATRVPATSLQMLRGGPVDRRQVLADLLAAVERRYDRFEHDGFTGLERDELRGRTVKLVEGQRGIAQGVDAQGRLVVDGQAYASAEVERVDLDA